METPTLNKRIIFYWIISIFVIVGLWKDFGSLITKSIWSGNPVQYLVWTENPVKDTYQFNSPLDILINKNGDIYIIDVGKIGYKRRTILRFDSSWKFLTQFSEHNNGGSDSMDPPIAIASDAQGNIYAIIDTVDELQVRKFDPSGKLLMKFGRKWGNNGEFQAPSDIAVDSQWNIYISDTDLKNIQKFDPSGKIVMKISTQAHKLAIDSQDNLYVADGEKSRIQKFDSSGKLLTQFSSQGIEQDEYSYFWDITFGKDWYLYIVDIKKNSIKKITNSWIFLSEISTAGKGITGIALDNAGIIYATDDTNGRIQKFTQSSTAPQNKDTTLPITEKDFPIVEKFEATSLKPSTELKLVSQFDISSDVLGAIAFDKYENIYIADTWKEGRVRKIDSSGKLLMDFTIPWFWVQDITIDTSGNIYLSLRGENDQDKVRKFDSSGKFLMDFGNTNNSQIDDRILRVWHIATDINNNIYVDTMIGILKFDFSGKLLANAWISDNRRGIAIDTAGNIYTSADERIYKMDSSGKLLISFAAEGINDDERVWPGALAVNSHGDLYVNDTSNHAIKKYSSSGEYISQFKSNGYDVSIDKSGYIYILYSDVILKFKEMEKE